MGQLTVVEDAEHEQFEARADDGAVAGFISYDGAASEGAVVLLHTVVEPEREGQGVGGALARGALDLIRASGRKVVVLCPFVTAFIRRHPEYADLVREQA